MSWFVYMLLCDGTALYTGVTTDVRRRLREHQSGGARAARYTRSRRKIALVYWVEVGDKSLAMQVEYRLKQLSAARKRAIAKQCLPLKPLLDLLELPV